MISFSLHSNSLFSTDNDFFLSSSTIHRLDTLVTRHYPAVSARTPFGRTNKATRVRSVVVQSNAMCRHLTLITEMDHTPEPDPQGIPGLNAWFVWMEQREEDENAIEAQQNELLYDAELHHQIDRALSIATSAVQFRPGIFRGPDPEDDLEHSGSESGSEEETSEDAGSEYEHTPSRSALQRAQIDEKKYVRQLRAEGDKEYAGFNWAKDLTLPETRAHALRCFSHGRVVRPRPSFSGWEIKQNPESMRGQTSKQLFPYQLEDVGYAAYLEQELKGVILAQAMGLGKTLQAIAVSEINPGPTVIVAPSNAILDQWVVELKANITRPLRILRYTSVERNTYRAKGLERIDYILVTYKTLGDEVSMMRKTLDEIKDHVLAGYTTHDGVPLPRTSLLTGHYWRIIADETHYIRGNGLMADALCMLQSLHRVAITGTPQQNNYAEWLPLFKFLRVKPWGMNDKVFSDYFLARKGDGKDQLAKMDNIRGGILTMIFLAYSVRRSVDETFNGVPITTPPLEHTKNFQYLDLDDGTNFPFHCFNEQDYQERSRRIWGQFTKPEYHDRSEPPLLLKGETGFTGIKRALRGYVHPNLMMLKGVDKPKNVRPRPEAIDGEVGDRDFIIKMHRKDWIAWHRERRNSWQSTVLLTARELVRWRLIQDKLNSVIVFDEWIGSLDLLQIGLEELDIPCLRLDRADGKNDKETQSVIDQFKNPFRDPARPMRVLLSTKASGAVGLNLQIATSVVFLSPGMNLMTDMQALGRALRVGQTNHVYVYFLLANRSMTDKVMDMWNKKQANAAAITDLATDAESNAVADMRTWSDEKFLKMVCHQT